MGREEGGGFRMGNTCIPVADSFRYLTKLTQYCKVKKKKKRKEKEKEKKITADGDCSHEIKRRLLLGRKVMTNLDSILKAETLLCQQRSV